MSCETVRVADFYPLSNLSVSPEINHVGYMPAAYFYDWYKRGCFLFQRSIGAVEARGVDNNFVAAHDAHKLKERRPTTPVPKGIFPRRPLQV